MKKDTLRRRFQDFAVGVSPSPISLLATAHSPLAADRRTVDGVPVAVGDRVWRVDPYVARVTCCRLYRHHLGMWWETTSKEIYSTERAAVAAAIKNQRRELGKSRREVRRAIVAVEKLTARLKALDTL